MSHRIEASPQLSSAEPSSGSELLKVVAEASRLLVDTPAWDAVCPRILKMLAQSLRADRVTLFYKTATKNNKGKYYDWPEMPAVNRAVAFGVDRQLPRVWINKLRKGNAIIGNSASLSKLDQTLLQERQAQSLIMAALSSKSSWYGYISAETSQQNRDWSDAELEALKCIATTFSAAMSSQAARRRRLQNKDRFVLTMEKAPCGIVYVDKNATITYANERCCNILGYTHEEMLSKDIYEHTYHEDKERYHKFLQGISHSTSETNTIEKRCIRKDGRIIWVSLTCLLAENSETDQDSFIIIVEDITERKATQQILQDSEQRFQIVSRATNDAIWDWTYETNTIWWNSKLETLFGYSADEIQPAYSWWEEHVHPQDRLRILRELEHTVARKQPVWTAEYRFQYGNGSYATVIDRAYIIYDSKGRAIRMIGSMQDISKQKKAETSLRNSQQQLRNLAKQMTFVREDERKHLSRELHDEFAQILTALKMDLQWLGGKLPDEFKLLRERTRAMSEIVDTTMDRVRQIATELRPALIDDLGICAAIDWQLKEFYARTGCACAADIALNEEKIDADLKITLFRVFQEALSNVARHTRATRVDVKLHEEDNIVFLQVRDNGDGIPAKKLNDVHSIGLIGMRERAGAFGGVVNIESIKNKGTTVNVRIPLSATVYVS